MLHAVKEERNILHTIKQRKAEVYWSHLAYKLPLKQVIEGKTEGKIIIIIIIIRYKIYDFKKTKRQSKLKEEALDR